MVRAVLSPMVSGTKRDQIFDLVIAAVRNGDDMVDVYPASILTPFALDREMPASTLVPKHHGVFCMSGQSLPSRDGRVLVRRVKLVVRFWFFRDF